MGKYTQKNLGSNERVISEAQLHAIVLLPHILLMLIVIGFFTIISPLVSLFTKELAVTNKNVIGKRGLIGRRTLSTPLNKINNVSVDVGIMGRLLK
ncbi:MAG: PH domain-containing protein, partial [Clostridiales bacterium]|nr:PH domain-containing protein [Clostridiales bacterium]